ncbi:MAG: serine hydrolase [Burkholderiaceae bacterium]
MFQKLVRSTVALILAFAGVTAFAADPSQGLHLQSPRALVMDATTGEVLFDKNADKVASIASLTKLLTAMVILDANLNPYDVLRIAEADLDIIKFTHSGVPVGAMFTRRTLLRLALMSSDNHATAALARTFKGGNPAFLEAMNRKILALGLANTFIEEPTGLSPNNRSNATDLAQVLLAASTYPEISDITSQSRALVDVNGAGQVFRNTNRLVGSPGWNIKLSKTGFIREAGVCVTMMLEEAGRNVIVVLLGARGGEQRARDALSIRHWLARHEPSFATLSAAASEEPLQ